MKKFAIVLAMTVSSTAAFAQADMSCADYLKADAQMQAAMSPAEKAAVTADPSAAALDRKVKTYCVANPKSPVSEAMTKAMQ